MIDNYDIKSVTCTVTVSKIDWLWTIKTAHTQGHIKYWATNCWKSLPS